MSFAGWYYLHENNDLIFKNKHYPVEDIRESDFAIGLWPCDTEDRAGAWRIVVEAAAAGARTARIEELVEKWGLTDQDALIYAERTGFILKKDGDVWCAHRSDFKNLQESKAGFGRRAFDAIVALCKDLGFRPGKMWNQEFKDLVKCDQQEKL